MFYFHLDVPARKLVHHGCSGASEQAVLLLNPMVQFHFVQPCTSFVISDNRPDTNYKVCEFISNLVTYERESDDTLSTPLSLNLYFSFQLQEFCVDISVDGELICPFSKSYLEWLEH